MPPDTLVQVWKTPMGVQNCKRRKKVLLTQLCSPYCLCLPNPASVQHLQDGHVLTLIIWERSPASASSRTMLSSLSSIKESKYLIMLGWFSCCRGRECKRNSYNVLMRTPRHTTCTSCDPRAKRSESRAAPDKSCEEQPFPQAQHPGDVLSKE